MDYTSKEYLKLKFNEYNSLYFDGKLGKCVFHKLYSDTYAFGRYAHIVKNGKTEDSIWIGTNTVWNENKIREVLIHEMIHMYVRTVLNISFDGIFGHGYHFRKECRRFRKTYGIDIPIHSHFEYKDKKKPLPNILERLVLWIIDR